MHLLIQEGFIFIYVLSFSILFKKPTQKRKKYSYCWEILQIWLIMLKNETKRCKSPNNQLYRIFKIPNNFPIQLCLEGIESKNFDELYHDE